MKVYFKEDSHSYFNEEHEQYISVSALVKKLEPIKDWESIKKKYAKKKGLSVQQITKDWDNKKLLGTQAGTLVHRKSELERLASPQAIINNVECSIISCSFSDGLKWSEPSLKLKPNSVYPEKMIYNHKYKVCGQADEVWTASKTLNVFDIKTDKSIDRQAYSSEWVPAEKLLGPVDHLENCNFNIYSLKMSMYMYMLWMENKDFRVGDLILEWQPILRDDEGIPILNGNGEPTILRKEIIKVPYRRQEVKDIFDWYKKGKL